MALAPPVAGITDPPTNGCGINLEWVSHIIGALECLNREHAWSGDSEAAQQAIMHAMYLLQKED